MGWGDEGSVRVDANSQESSSLRFVSAAILTMGGAVLCIGTLRPWISSGTKRRHSYDIIELIERLGFAPDGPMAIGLRAWPLTPLLVIVAVTAAWWGRFAVAAGVGAVAGVYGGGMATAVVLAPHAPLIDVLDGPRWTMVGASAVTLGSVCCGVVAISRNRAPEPTRP